MKTSTLILAAVFAGTTVMAAPFCNIKCESQHDMRAASALDGKYLVFTDGGNTGKCFSMTCPQGRKDILFHGNQQFKVESSSAPIKVSIQIKGTGTFNFGFLCYDKNRKNIYPGGTSMKAEAKDPNKWTKFEFTFTPKAGGEYTQKIGFILPAVYVPYGSKISMDDFTMEFIQTNKNIEIED